MGLGVAHVLERAPRRELSGPELFRTHQLYRGWGAVGGLSVSGAMLAAAVTGFLDRRRTCGYLPLLSALATLATVAVWRLGNEPLNRAVRDWEGNETVPADWVQLRERWENAHTMSAVLHGLAFASMLGHERG